MPRRGGQGSDGVGFGPNSRRGEARHVRDHLGSPIGLNIGCEDDSTRGTANKEKLKSSKKKIMRIKRE